VDREAEEGQQTKGDEMTLGDFMDVLGRLHKLTPAQRRAVAEVLAEPDAVSKLVAKPASSPRKNGYTEDELRQLWAYVKAESSYTAKEKMSIKRAFAMEFGRTKKAIDIQISNFKTGKRSVTK
jgi:hypothetical protein